MMSYLPVTRQFATAKLVWIFAFCLTNKVIGADPLTVLYKVRPSLEQKIKGNDFLDRLTRTLFIDDVKLEVSDASSCGMELLTHLYLQTSESPMVLSDLDVIATSYVAVKILPSQKSGIDLKTIGKLDFWSADRFGAISDIHKSVIEFRNALWRCDISLEELFRSPIAFQMSVMQDSLGSHFHEIERRKSKATNQFDHEHIRLELRDKFFKSMPIDPVISVESEMTHEAEAELGFAMANSARIMTKELNCVDCIDRINSYLDKRSESLPQSEIRDCLLWSIEVLLNIGSSGKFPEEAKPNVYRLNKSMLLHATNEGMSHRLAMAVGAMNEKVFGDFETYQAMQMALIETKTAADPKDDYLPPQFHARIVANSHVLMELKRASIRLDLYQLPSLRRDLAWLSNTRADRNALLKTFSSTAQMGNPTDRICVARLLIENGNADQASMELDLVGDLRELEPLVLTRLAGLRFTLHQYAEAKRVAYLASIQRPLDSRNLSHSARSLFMDAEYDKAEELSKIAFLLKCDVNSTITHRVCSIGTILPILQSGEGVVSKELLSETLRLWKLRVLACLVYTASTLSPDAPQLRGVNTLIRRISAFDITNSDVESVIQITDSMFEIVDSI